MINAAMRLYPYFTIGEKNKYGQVVIPGFDAIPTGTIKMAINLSSQSVQDAANYTNAQYTGLTNAEIDDTYIIDFNGKRLKVLYVNTFGRLNQAFMELMP